MTRRLVPVGHLVQQAREQAGITRSELTRRLHGPRGAGSHLNRIERDEASPTVDTLQRIAAALDLVLIIEFRRDAP